MLRDILELALSYVQYLSLIIAISPLNFPSFYSSPTDAILKYLNLDFQQDLFTEGAREARHNFLQVDIPDRIPLDVRLWFLSISVVLPLVLNYIGIVVLAGKKFIVWFAALSSGAFGLTWGMFYMLDDTTATTSSSSSSADDDDANVLWLKTFIPRNWGIFMLCLSIAIVVTSFVTLGCVLYYLHSQEKKALLQQALMEEAAEEAQKRQRAEQLERLKNRKQTRRKRDPQQIAFAPEAADEERIGGDGSPRPTNPQSAVSGGPPNTTNTTTTNNKNDTNISSDQQHATFLALMSSGGGGVASSQPNPTTSDNNSRAQSMSSPVMRQQQMAAEEAMVARRGNGGVGGGGGGGGGEGHAFFLAQKRRSTGARIDSISLYSVSGGSISGAGGEGEDGDGGGGGGPSFHPFPAGGRGGRGGVAASLMQGSAAVAHHRNASVFGEEALARVIHEGLLGGKRMGGDGGDFHSASPAEHGDADANEEGGGGDDHHTILNSPKGTNQISLSRAATKASLDLIMRREVEKINRLQTLTRLIYAILFFIVGCLLTRVIDPLAQVTLEDMENKLAREILFGFGIVFFIAGVVAFTWFVLGLFYFGRVQQFKFGSFLRDHFVSVLLLCISVLYIPSVTNVIIILNCEEVSCNAGTRLRDARSSLFSTPASLSFLADSNSVVNYNGATNSGALRCEPCFVFGDDTLLAIANETLSGSSSGDPSSSASASLIGYPLEQHCPAVFSSSLCLASSDSRLREDASISCDEVKRYFWPAAGIVFVCFVLSVPILNFLLTRISTRLISTEFPLDPRQVVGYSEEDIYRTKVDASDNVAKFIYDPFQKRFKQWRLLFIFQKLAIVVVSVFSFSIASSSNDTALTPQGVALLLSLLIHFVCLVLHIVVRPFNRRVENIFVIVTQLGLTVTCAVGFTNSVGAEQQRRSNGSDSFASSSSSYVPAFVGNTLAVACYSVPLAALAVGAMLTFRDEIALGEARDDVGRRSRHTVGEIETDAAGVGPDGRPITLATADRQVADASNNDKNPTTGTTEAPTANGGGGGDKASSTQQQQQQQTQQQTQALLLIAANATANNNNNVGADPLLNGDTVYTSEKAIALLLNKDRSHLLERQSIVPTVALKGSYGPLARYWSLIGGGGGGGGGGGEGVVRRRFSNSGSNTNNPQEQQQQQHYYAFSSPEVPPNLALITTPQSPSSPHHFHHATNVNAFNLLVQSPPTVSITTVVAAATTHITNVGSPTKASFQQQQQKHLLPSAMVLDSNAVTNAYATTTATAPTTAAASPSITTVRGNGNTAPHDNNHSPNTNTNTTAIDHRSASIVSTSSGGGGGLLGVGAGGAMRAWDDYLVALLNDGVRRRQAQMEALRVRRAKRSQRGGGGVLSLLGLGKRGKGGGEAEGGPTKEKALVNLHAKRQQQQGAGGGKGKGKGMRRAGSRSSVVIAPPFLNEDEEEEEEEEGRNADKHRNVVVERGAPTTTTTSKNLFKSSNRTDTDDADFMNHAADHAPDANGHSADDDDDGVGVGGGNNNYDYYDGNAAGRKRAQMLLRLQLKRIYERHLYKLVSLQRGVDFKINTSIINTLIIFFSFCGICAIVAFSSSLLGVMGSSEGQRFVTGTRQATDASVEYQLLNYSSWEDFTSHCCCLPFSRLAPAWPHYVVEGEKWVCRRRGGGEGDSDAFSPTQRAAVVIKERFRVILDNRNSEINGASLNFFSGSGGANVDDLATNLSYFAYFSSSSSQYSHNTTTTDGGGDPSSSSNLFTTVSEASPPPAFGTGLGMRPLCGMHFINNCSVRIIEVEVVEGSGGDAAQRRLVTTVEGCFDNAVRKDAAWLW